MSLIEYLLVSVLLFSCSNSRVDYTELIDYDLGFENRDPYRARWSCVKSNVIAGGDSTDIVEGKSSFVMIRRKHDEPFNACFYQTIILPISPKQIQVSIYSKTSDVEKAWLKLFGLNECNKITSRDSICLLSSNKWKKSTLKVDGFNTKRAYLEISAGSTKKHAIDVDTIIKRMKSGKGMSEKAISVDNISIALDDKDISQYDCFDSETLEISENVSNDYVSFATNPIVDLVNLDDFKDHSIIAFGESVHGSREIQETTLKTISELVKRNNCKLILFEFPFDLGLRINEFIYGETEEDISKLLLFNNLDIPSFVKFFNWLRTYNHSQDNKVTVMGIDENKGFKIEDDLNVFINNAYPRDSSMYKLSLLIKNKEFEEALLLVQTRLAANFNDCKLKCILNAIKLRTTTTAFFPYHEDERELILFQNSKFAIDAFTSGTEKTAIFAHLGHVSKLHNLANRIYAKNMGHYLFQTYSNNYFSVAISVGNGTITSFGENGFEFNCKLITPPRLSLESLCLRSGVDYFYTRNENLYSISSERFIGAFYSENQFYSYSNCGSFDGVIFIRNSTGNRLPNDWPISKVEIQEFAKMNMKQIR
ncbi:erythromycin esterase family protein [Sunxiuqinia sp. A32]|uniref:erythromycin esterase family protein n=1 Tax=Sunxiuqinia sp. A32 TaxID=3461496 RepID=UPI0040462FA8